MTGTIHSVTRAMRPRPPQITTTANTAITIPTIVLSKPNAEFNARLMVFACTEL